MELRAGRIALRLPLRLARFVLPGLPGRFALGRIVREVPLLVRGSDRAPPFAHTRGTVRDLTVPDDIANVLRASGPSNRGGDAGEQKLPQLHAAVLLHLGPYLRHVRRLEVLRVDPLGEVLEVRLVRPDLEAFVVHLVLVVVLILVLVVAARFFVLLGGCGFLHDGRDGGGEGREVLDVVVTAGRPRLQLRERRVLRSLRRLRGVVPPADAQPRLVPRENLLHRVKAPPGLHGEERHAVPRG